MSDWRPSAPRAALELRAGLYRTIRAFFDTRGVLEVETPVLSAFGSTDPNIESFRTTFSGSVAAGERGRWLRTSPEYPLKRLVAAGYGDCYELGRVFRNGETGRRHNPEFTMLEWYRVGWDHRRLMDEVAELVLAALALVGRRVPVRRSSYRELFLERAGVDPFAASEGELHDAVSDFGICTDGLSRDDWLQLVLTHRVEPTLSAEELLLVYDFPPSQCALARIRHAPAPAVAERFEAYLGPIELANGYHELADAEEQSLRFASDVLRRRARGAAEPEADPRLIEAMEAGLPDCAGVALGVDRLLMAMQGAGGIDEVVAFPFART